MLGVRVLELGLDHEDACELLESLTVEDRIFSATDVFGAAVISVRCRCGCGIFGRVHCGGWLRRRFVVVLWWVVGLQRWCRRSRSRVRWCVDWYIWWFGGRHVVFAILDDPQWLDREQGLGIEVVLAGTR